MFSCQKFERTPTEVMGNDKTLRDYDAAKTLQETTFDEDISSYKKTIAVEVPDDFSTEKKMKEKEMGCKQKIGKYSVHDICVLIAFICGNFCCGAYLSILAPFFPQQAVAKGMSTTVIGLVFSSYEVAIVIFSPLFGNYLSEIGSKFTYVCGLGVTGISCILFGLLDYSPGGPAYVIVSLLTRFIEGIGLAAFLVSSLTIMAGYFPERATTLASSSGACVAAGIMVGPAVGGVLYENCGYVLTFILFGSMTVLMAFISMFLLTPQVVHQKKKESIFHLLKIPLVLLVCFVFFISSAVAGVRNVGISLWLEKQFGFTPSFIGLVFCVQALSYIVTVILVGYLSDRLQKKSLLLMFVGLIALAISLMLLGPAPFLPLPDNILWLFIFSMLLFTTGSSTKTAFFKVVAVAAINTGMKEDSHLFAKISGLYHLCYASGNTVGPFLAGYLIEVAGFRWTSTIFGFAMILCIVLTLLYMIVDLINSSVNKQRTTEDTTSLIKADSQVDINSKTYKTMQDNQT